MKQTLVLLLGLSLLLSHPNNTRSETVEPDAAELERFFYTAGASRYQLLISTDPKSEIPLLLGLSRRLGSQDLVLEQLPVGTGLIEKNGNKGVMRIRRTEQLEEGKCRVYSDPPSSFGLNGLHQVQTFTPTETGLVIETEWYVTDTLAVDADISLDLTLPNATSFRALNSQGIIELQDDGTDDGFMQQHAVSQGLSDLQLVIVFGNTFAGDVLRRGESTQLRVIRTTRKLSDYDGPRVHSVLVPGQRIYRMLRLYVEYQRDFFLPYEGVFATTNPHRSGALGSIVFLGDDIPMMGDWWVPLTDSNSPAPLMATLAQMMYDNPDLRMSIVVTFDHLTAHYPYGPDRTHGWHMDRGNLAYVRGGTEGNRCLRMEVAADDTVSLYQQIGRLSRPDPEFAFSLKGEEGLAGGFRLVLENSTGEIVDQSELFVPLSSWTEYRWIADVDDLNDPLNLKLVLEKAGGVIHLDDLRLVGNTGEMSISNGGFEFGETSLWFDEQEESWLHEHCILKLTHSPDEFIEFMHRIAGSQKVYGYEDRLRLGLHAYHHSQKGDFVGKTPYMSEFSSPDPQFQREIFEMMFTDAMELGLDSSDFRTLRTANIRYQHSTIQEAIRHGVIWMDSESDGLGVGIFPMYGSGASLWMHRRSFWGDDPTSGWSRLMLTRRTLDMGGTAHWGWHPAAGLDSGNPERLEWFNRMFAELEESYPNSVWEFAEDIGDRGNGFETWRFLADSLKESEYHYRFHAKVDSGMSLSLHFADSLIIGNSAMLDQSSLIPLTFFDNYATLELPNLPEGDHEVVFYHRRIGAQPQRPQKQDLLLPKTPFYRVWPVPTNGLVRVTWVAPELSGRVDYSLFDVLGRHVLSDSWNVKSGGVVQTLQLDELASGTYFMLMHNSVSDLRKEARIILLK